MTKILYIVIFFTSASKSFSDLLNHGGIVTKFYEPRKVIYVIYYIPMSIVTYEYLLYKHIINNNIYLRKKYGRNKEYNFTSEPPSWKKSCVVLGRIYLHLCM